MDGWTDESIAILNNKTVTKTLLLRSLIENNLGKLV